MSVLEPCPNCGQLSEREHDDGVTWCRECLANRWKQETETLRLFAPARAEIPGQTGLSLD